MSEITEKVKLARRRALMLVVASIITILSFLYAFLQKNENKRLQVELAYLRIELTNCSEELVVSKMQIKDLSKKLSTNP